MSDLRAIATQVEATVASCAGIASDAADIHREILRAVDVLDDAVKRLGGTHRLTEAVSLLELSGRSVTRLGDAASAAIGPGRQWLGLHATSSPAHDPGSAPSGGEAHPQTADGSSGPTGDAELDAIWEQSAETPAGRAFYSEDELEMRKSAQSIPPFPGEFLVDIHGNPHSVGVGSRAMTAGELAMLIRADDKWSAEPIRLFSCDTGTESGGFAQQLADELGVPVIAPDTPAWCDGEGNWSAASIGGHTPDGDPVPTDPPDGNWRTFEPGSHVK